MEVRQVPADMCPILVVAPNTSTRNMLTGCLEACGADVSAAVDEKEAATHLDGDVPPVTAILSLSLPQWQGLSRHPAVLSQSHLRSCTCNSDFYPITMLKPQTHVPRGHHAELSRKRIRLLCNGFQAPFVFVPGKVVCVR